MWPLIGAMSTTTGSLRFCAAVDGLPLFHPFPVARSAATADALAPGRVILGVGAGWMREEYDAFVEEARASLVRWPSDEALFDVARYGWIGASQPGAPTVLSRVAGLYMDSGENSCGRYVRHMQAADVF